MFPEDPHWAGTTTTAMYRKLKPIFFPTGAIYRRTCERSSARALNVPVFSVGALRLHPNRRWQILSSPRQRTLLSAFSLGPGRRRENDSGSEGTAHVIRKIYAHSALRTSVRPTMAVRINDLGAQRNHRRHKNIARSWTTDPGQGVRHCSVSQEFRYKADPARPYP